MATGKFEMRVDKNKKVFEAHAEGFFTMEQGLAFCKAFEDSAKECSRTGDYTLIVDAAQVKPSTPEVSEALGQALGLYASPKFKFKERKMKKLSSKIAQIQVERLADKTPNFKENITFID